MDYDLSRKTTRMGRFGIAAVVVLMFWVMLLNSGCVFTGAGDEGPTPRQQLTTMYDIYNGQYADYMITTGYVKEDGTWVKVSTPALTETQKTILRKKKTVLTEVRPMIKVYDSYVTNNGVPPPELAGEIMLLLNRLL